MSLFDSIVTNLPNLADMTGYQPPDGGPARSPATGARKSSAAEFSIRLLRLIAALTLLTRLIDLGVTLWPQGRTLSSAEWALHLIAIAAGALVVLVTFIPAAKVPERWELYAFTMDVVVLTALTLNGLLDGDSFHLFIFLVLYAALTGGMLPWRPRWQAGFSAMVLIYFVIALFWLHPGLSGGIYWSYAMVAAAGVSSFINLLMNRFRETVSAQLQALLASQGQLCAEAIEREAAESRLARSEVNLRAIIENSPDAIGVTALADFRFILVNQAFEQTFGLSRTEIIGRQAKEFSFGLGEDDYDLLSAKLREGGVRGYMMPVLNKRGDATTILVSAVQVE